MIDSKNKNCDSNSLLLDSRLITRTNLENIDLIFFDKPKVYDYKIVSCGDFIQVYYFPTSRIKYPTKEDNIDLKLKKIIKDDVKNLKVVNNGLNEIRLENIIRSKLQCQRIAKCNICDWETFITLTFKENLTDLKIANKSFQNFIRQIKRCKNDFKYICIPEFQKRGAIHYHLLCNIKFTDNKLLYLQEDNPKFKHIKYWNEGFTSIEEIKGDIKKVIGYIAKYMTKDIDNRLFGFRRFFYSQNCNVPQISYIDSQENKDFEFLQKKIQDKDLIYQNSYTNNYDNSEVNFLEFSKTNISITRGKEK